MARPQGLDYNDPVMTDLFKLIPLGVVVADVWSHIEASSLQLDLLRQLLVVHRFNSHSAQQTQTLSAPLIRI